MEDNSYRRTCGVARHMLPPNNAARNFQPSTARSTIRTFEMKYIGMFLLKLLRDNRKFPREISKNKYIREIPTIHNSTDLRRIIFKLQSSLFYWPSI